MVWRLEDGGGSNAIRGALEAIDERQCRFVFFVGSIFLRELTNSYQESGVAMYADAVIVFSCVILSMQCRATLTGFAIIVAVIQECQMHAHFWTRPRSQPRDFSTRVL